MMIAAGLNKQQPIGQVERQRHDGRQMWKKMGSGMLPTEAFLGTAHRVKVVDPFGQGVPS
jgi:hypothetical protein